MVEDKKVPEIRFDGFSEGWKNLKLIEIAPLQRGFDLPQTMMKKGSYPVVMSNGVLRYHDEYKAKGPGVVTGRSGTIGAVHYIETNYWPHNTSLWVTDFMENDPMFIYYLFITFDFGRFGTGSGVPTLNRNDVHDIHCFIPQITKEQTAIGNFFRSLDDTIALKKQQHEKTVNIKKAMLDKMFPKNGADVPEIRFNGFAESWETEIFGTICSIVRGGSPRPIENYITSSDNGINWIKIGDVDRTAKYINRTEEKIIPEGISMSRMVNKGDFILSNSMSFGRPYIMQIDGCIHDGWLAIQNYKDRFNTEFLYYLLSSERVMYQYKERAAGSTVKNLNKDLVASIEVIIPHIKEQIAIAAFLSSLDSLIASHQQEIEKLQNIKKSCLNKMFV